MKVAWFHAFAGIAGDMALGALIDVGADPAAIEAGCRRLGYDGWTMRHETVDRSGLQGTHVRIDIEPQHHHRRAAEIIERIEGAGLADRAARWAVDTFRLLAEVEGRLHGVDPADVHFHEVGAVDSIVDIVGVAVALDDLGVDELHAGPVAIGVGTVGSAHGTLPNPAPAVARLLEGRPVRGVDVPMELTTPTGAALLAALATRWGPLPDGRVLASGYGAGTRNPPGRPNLLQVVLAETATAEGASATDPGGRMQTVCLLETNLDDVTGETLGFALQRLLDDGALDVWHTPITMKKSRPAVALSALCRPEDAVRLRTLMARETGTLGIRVRSTQRWVADRRTTTVTVDGHPVRVKHGPFGAKAEHDDVATAAQALGRPYRSVRQDAQRKSGEPAVRAEVGDEGR